MRRASAPWRRATGATRLLLALGVLWPAQASAGDVLLAAAVSLREPLLLAARDFEHAHPDTEVTASFGASSTLAVQARAGAPIDVFVSADPSLVDQLGAEAWVAARQDLARNALVLVSRPSLPLRHPDDLLSVRVRRIALPAAAVPLGAYARAWLERRALLEPLSGRIVQTEHARATLAAVDHGHADAAIVYATDARAVAAERSELAIPAAEQPTIVYTAALRRGAGVEAGQLFAHLGSPGTLGHLIAAGLGAP